MYGFRLVPLTTIINRTLNYENDGNFTKNPVSGGVPCTWLPQLYFDLRLHSCFRLFILFI